VRPTTSQDLRTEVDGVPRRQQQGRGVDSVGRRRAGPVSLVTIHRRRPARSAHGGQPAVGVICTVSALASLGRGMVTSSTPSCVLALIFFASTPAGIVMEREKAP
jgi:hypothetical protein